MRNIGQLSLNIDLLFGTSRLADIKADIKQDKDTWGSDHYPIEVTLNEEVHRYRKRANRISTKKIIWKNYPKVVLKKYEKRKEHRRNGKELRNEVSRIYKDIKGSHERDFRKKRREKG